MQTTDQTAIDRYRYLLRTAPPEQIEQAHAEAFAQLTFEQRRQVLAGLGEDPQRATEDPRSLARLATRAEMRRPGSLERAFGGSRGNLMGGLLAGVAGAFIATTAMDALFDHGPGDFGLFDVGGFNDFGF